MLEFSKRLKLLREINNITLKQVSQYIGVGTSAVSGYELYNKEPPYDKLCQLAKIFNVTTDYLLGLSNDLHDKTLQTCLKITELIKSRKISEEECAKEIGIDTQIIIEIVKHKKLPSYEILDLIFDYFDIPFSEMEEQIKELFPKCSDYILNFLVDEVNLPYIKLAMKLKENDNKDRELLNWVESIINFKLNKY